MTLHPVFSEADEEEFAAALHSLIRAFNDSHSPHHAVSRRPGAVRPLHLMLRSEAGEVVGGLSAHTNWDWLEIEHLYVPEKERGRGVGTALLERAERVAVGRGAGHALLTTFEFQARAFYEARGYHVVGRVEGYPPGSTYYWMRKELDDRQAQTCL